MKMLMKIGLPKMRGVLVMTMASISPSGREVPPAELLHRRAKVLMSKFRLETATFPPESPLVIFSRSKDLKYQKMSTGGGPCWAQLSRAHLGGLACPGVLCSPGGPPTVVICSSIFYIIQNNSPESFSLFGDVQNRYL